MVSFSVGVLTKIVVPDMHKALSIHKIRQNTKMPTFYKTLYLADESVIQTLKNSSYAAIFTEGNIEENSSTIILASGMTVDELNKEKSKTIDRVESAGRI